MNKVLWTGGWDSTFRVLDLVINKKTKVQPYYVLDKRRRSNKIELATMEKIKQMVFSIDKDAGEKIEDTIIIKIEEIPQNEQITKDYEELRSISHLGNQYDWLARYARSENITDLELCIHLDDKAEGFIKNDVEFVETEKDSYYRMKKSLSLEQLRILSYFHYPLLKITKLDMDKEAKRSGFSHIMEETWFCFNPVNNQPCGQCNPCKYTKEEGLGRRVPNSSRLWIARGILNKTVHRIKLRLVKP